LLLYFKEANERYASLGGKNMESNKSKILRVVKTIYDIIPKKFVAITKDGEDKIFQCKNINGELDLYQTDKNSVRWGLSCENLDDMRKSLLQDFLEEYFEDIKSK
jgi:hypothetical protein